MDFEVIGDITGTETIATGAGIRERARLRKRYGAGRWRKRKGFAEIRLLSGEITGPSYTGTKLPVSASEK